ncbi:MAG: threonine-phosphate decarboxylase CobD [Nostocaceae cyanobacterium]|nr:threonine-phosphate decarboxylase CobD [Nostocaceae cyanobacterium]
MRPEHGGNLAWAVALAGCSPDAILDFSASISPLGPPKGVLRAIASQLGNLRHYPDPNCGELRLALSHAHHLPPEWILPGNGSAELLTLAGRELASLAATVVLSPAFGDYYRALKAFDAKVLELPLISPESLGTQVRVPVLSLEEGWGNPLQGRENPLQGRENPAPTDCGLLLNNPHNPTGCLLKREAILPYLEQFALVVVDEAFMDFLPPEEEQSVISVVEKYPNLVILRSLTKFYSLPGLRLGYAIAHPERLKLWRSWRDPWSVNSLAQAAAVAALQDEEFQQQTWNWLPPARNKLFQGLAQIPGLQPLESTANFLLVATQQPSSQLQQRLLTQHQILIRDCLSFKELGEHYFRVAVRSDTENQRLIAALSS